MEYTFHEPINAGNGVLRMAVGNTKDELFESIFRIMAEAKGYKPPEIALADKPLRLFGEYADEWLKLYANVRENTKSRYESKVNILKAFFGDKPLISIEPKDVQLFFTSRAEYSLSYNRDVKNILSQILDSAYEDGYVERNVAKSSRVHVMGKKPKERVVLEKAEDKAIMQLIPQIDRLEDRLFLALSFYTGMRPCEIYGLRWEDVYLGERPYIRVEQGAPLVHGRAVIKEPKTKAGRRSIPMPPFLVEVLKPHVGTGLILHNKTGEPYTEQMRKLQRKRVQKLTGIDGLVPYDLRHNRVTKWVEAGAGIKATQAMAGHADTRPTLDIYAHTTDEMLNDAAIKLEAQFEKIASEA